MSKLVDMRGDVFHEKYKVARAVVSGSSGYIEICTVTKIENGRLYLDDMKQPIRYPNRLLIIEKDPLIDMVEKYEKSKVEQRED